MNRKKSASKKTPVKKAAKTAQAIKRESKKTVKNIRGTFKAITGAYKKVSGAREKRDIERLLGEEYDTLAQARRALKRESKPVKSKPGKQPVKQSIKKQAIKQTYKLRELASSKSHNIGVLANSLEKNAAKIDALKSPTEDWAFRIYENYSLTLFSSIGSVGNVLRHYPSLNSKAIDNISVVKIDKVGFKTEKQAVQTFQGMVKEQRESRKMKQSNIRREAVKMFGGTSDNKRKKSTVDLLEDALRYAKQRDEVLEDLQKRIMELESRSQKTSKKKAAKKTSTRKAGKKNVKR